MRQTQSGCRFYAGVVAPATNTRESNTVSPLFSNMELTLVRLELMERHCCSESAFKHKTFALRVHSQQATAKAKNKFDYRPMLLAFGLFMQTFQ